MFDASAPHASEGFPPSALEIPTEPKVPAVMQVPGKVYSVCLKAASDGRSAMIRANITGHTYKGILWLSRNRFAAWCTKHALGGSAPWQFWSHCAGSTMIAGYYSPGRPGSYSRPSKQNAPSLHSRSARYGMPAPGRIFSTFVETIPAFGCHFSYKAWHEPRSAILTLYCPAISRAAVDGLRIPVDKPIRFPLILHS